MVLLALLRHPARYRQYGVACHASAGPRRPAAHERPKATGRRREHGTDEGTVMVTKRTAPFSAAGSRAAHGATAGSNRGSHAQPTPRHLRHTGRIGRLPAGIELHPEPDVAEQRAGQPSGRPRRGESRFVRRAAGFLSATALCVPLLGCRPSESSTGPRWGSGAASEETTLGSIGVTRSGRATETSLRGRGSRGSGHPINSDRGS